MILPALAPALILLGQPGAAERLPPVDTGRFASVLQASGNAAASPVAAIEPAPQPPPQAAPPPPPRETAATDPAALPAVPVRGQHAPGDPLEGFNRRMFKIQDGLDRAIIRPAAIGYRHAVPKPVRSGIRHFLSNLTEPIVLLNYLLQLKPGKAAKTLARFTVNSTLGVGGLIDVAKLPSIGLPHRPNGFGDTLGFYGVKPGPYLFLPLVGPTDLRDFLGGQADMLTVPVLVASKPFSQREYIVPTVVVGGLDQREQADDDLRALYAGAVDPYATLRSTYLQDRQGEIDALKGRSAASPLLDEPLEDPGAKTGPPGTDAGAGPAAPDLSDPLTDPAQPQPAPPPRQP